MSEVMQVVATIWAFLTGLAIGMFVGYVVFRKDVMKQLEVFRR